MNEWNRVKQIKRHRILNGIMLSVAIYSRDITVQELVYASWTDAKSMADLQKHTVRLCLTAHN